MWIKRCGWAIVSLCLCILLLVPAAAADDDSSEKRQLLRIGFVSEPPFAYKDRAGEYDGYASELLYSIAMRADFNLQFVDFPNYEAEDQALIEGQIDMEAMVEQTEERRSKFIFTDTPTITTPLALLVRADNNRYEFGNMNAVNEMTVAGIKNDAITDSFVDWCKKNNLHPHMTYYLDSQKAFEALQKGEADGLTSANETKYNSHVLIYFAHINCYSMFNKDQSDLMHQYDRALQELLSENPMYEQQLYHEYVAPESGNMSTLSSEEKAFIASHKAITVAVQEDFPPLIYKNNDGTLQGILPDFYTQLSNKTGLSFVYKTYPTLAEAQKAVQNGQADILGIYGSTIQSAYDSGLRLINVSRNRNLVKIAKFGDTNAKTAAILANDSFYLNKTLTKDDYTLLGYTNIRDCYTALVGDQADCIICSDIMATWLFNNHRLDGYASTPLYTNGRIYIAVATGHDVLYSILSKGIFSTSPSLNGIIAANTLPQDTLHNIISRLPIWGLVTVVLVMTALVVLLIILIILLRRRYHERTAMAARELENEKEKLRLESLEKSAGEKNMFFSNISHDMRTPLNAILGYTHLAEKLPLSMELRDYLSKIHLSGNLLLNLINDTLLVSKISSNKLDIHLEPTGTDEINQSLTAAITAGATKGGVLFSMDDTHLRPRTVQADTLKLQKILLNLLSNAVKFTPPGGHVWYKVQDDPADAADPDIVFTIRDEGIGMSEAYQQKLYTPFAQEQREGYESQGTGLGLAIVKQLVDLLGGSIHAESAINKGTTFTVRLHLPEIIEAVRAAAPATVETASAVQLAGKRVLLCEDNELNAEIAVELLQGMGLTTDWAGNGQEGVERFCTAPPHTYAAILMDLRMPVLNGFEATEKLRHLDRADAQTIPIIAMTADAFEEDVKKCLAAGMNGHVAKPVNWTVLRQALEKALQTLP